MAVEVGLVIWDPEDRTLDEWIELVEQAGAEVLESTHEEVE